MTDGPQRIVESPSDVPEEVRLLAPYLQAAAPEPRPLSVAAVQRISRRLQSPRRRPGFGGRIALGLVFAAPLAVAAAWSLTRSSHPPREDPVPAKAAMVLEAEQDVLAPPSAPTVTLPLPAQPEVPSEKRSLTGPRKRTPRAVAKAEVQPPAEEPAAIPVMAPDPLMEESRLLQAALHQLRIFKDGESALGMLAEYDRRFPQGQLRAEVSLARMDSLLLLGRGAEALHALQQLSAGDRQRLPRARELEVLEVELQAELGRCTKALAQLERLRDGGPILAERALFVQATCEARSGRVERARSLFEELLRRYPDGAHAAQARRALGRTL